MLTGTAALFSGRGGGHGIAGVCAEIETVASELAGAI